MKRITLGAPLSLICLTALTLVACRDKAPSTGPGDNRTADVRTQSNQFDNRQVETDIRNIVAKVLHIEPDAVDVNAPLSKQKVAADELDVLEIVMLIEEASGVEIKDEEIANERGGISEDLSVKKLAVIVAGKKIHK